MQLWHLFGLTSSSAALQIRRTSGGAPATKPTATDSASRGPGWRRSRAARTGSSNWLRLEQLTSASKLLPGRHRSVAQGQGTRKSVPAHRDARTVRHRPPITSRAPSLLAGHQPAANRLQVPLSGEAIASPPRQGPSAEQAGRIEQEVASSGQPSREVPDVSVRTFAPRRTASRRGGSPNCRRYSRLNWAGLS